jgi:hypothetical protein
MAGKRFRLRHTFWLDLNKPDEEKLAETIDELKEKRSFAKTIRDGIQLVCDLRKGRVDVLFELFPWVKAEFLAGVGDKAMQQQLERLEKLLIEQGNQPLPLPAPKRMSVSQFDLPRIEDDQENLTGLVEIRRDTSTDATQNFLNSLSSL